MDDFMFHNEVKNCKYIPEDTSYLEILIYSDGTIYCEQHPLTDDEFENFLHRRGAFAPPVLRTGVRLVNGFRLVIQKDAKQDNTFSPRYITLQPDMYESMVKAFYLPTRGIEGTGLVGPCFWAAYDQNEENPHLQIIFRKSDVRKKGKTRGWESMLSYEFSTGITTGYVKGTPSSDIVIALEHLIDCKTEIGHPLLLPMIILSHDLSSKIDIKQREARHWLRRLENAITLRDEVVDSDIYKDFDVDVINRDLVECHSQVLWKRPQAYREIIKDIQTALDKFDAKFAGTEQRTKNIVALHHNMLSRLDFYRAKLTSMEHYIHTTLERLTIQRQALYNIMAQRESKLNLEMASAQRKLAHASKRDSTAMKALSLLGALFLPGTFVASVLSMQFFDFNVGPDSAGDENAGTGATVSREFWIYFVITVPLTLIVVGAWWLLDREREKKYELEDKDIDSEMQEMEFKIMRDMRTRTMSKTNTWRTPTPGQAP